MINTLKQADIFYELTATQLEMIASISTEKPYAEGDVIFEENTHSVTLYVIAEGEVEIQVDSKLIGKGSGEGPQTIATLRRGQSFGEVALVDQGLSSARARCGKPETRLILIQHSRLLKLCDSYPDLGYRLMRNLAADLAMKIRNTDLQMREYLTWATREA
ncbi:MAG: cyclic nucleotide-binding domain-containing protein [Chloroflexota bacterium]|nr:cyclic nucleotide-binding domain-containing protein [Chloroflexota bacterium]